MLTYISVYYCTLLCLYPCGCFTRIFDICFLHNLKPALSKAWMPNLPSTHHTQVSDTIFQESLVGGNIISSQPVLCSSTNIQFLTWGVTILLFKFICYHKHLRSTFNFSSATSVSSQISSINAWYKKTEGRPLGLKWILGKQLRFNARKARCASPKIHVE